jgi:hypothetical protein
MLALDQMASSIKDWGIYIPHDAYKTALKTEHCRKFGFWGAYGEAPIKPKTKKELKEEGKAEQKLHPLF